MKLRTLVGIGIGLGSMSTAWGQFSGPADLVISDGGDVTAQVVQWTGDPGDLDQFYYIDGSTSEYIGANSDWESGAPPVDLGTIAAGDEVLIGFFNTDTNTWFYTGPGARNPDGDIHALVTDLGNDEVRVDFEDLASYQGSDFNYGDGSIVITGVHSEAVPGPAALGVFAASAFGFIRRRVRS
jgi:hypothetical protein